MACAHVEVSTCGHHLYAERAHRLRSSVIGQPQTGLLFALQPRKPLAAPVFGLRYYARQNAYFRSISCIVTVREVLAIAQMKHELLTRLLKVCPPVLPTAVLLTAQAYVARAQIIPPSNRINWQLGSNVGVPGGIPNRTNIFTTLTSSATAAQINAAISACPSNQVVLLSSGIFTLNNTINIVKNGVSLRGSGPTTVLSPIHSNAAVISIGFYSTQTPGVPVTNGYAKDSTNLTVTDITGLSIGQLVYVDQIMDTNVMWASPNDGTARTVRQNLQVRGISGQTVAVWPPIHYPLIPNGNPLLHNWSGIGNQAMFDGVENLSINATSNGSAWIILLDQTYACWATNVYVTNQTAYGIYNVDTLFNEFCHCAFDKPQSTGSDHGGILLGNGIGTTAATSAAVYNNWSYQIAPCVEVNGGSSGNIIAYNYVRDAMLYGAAQAEGISMNHGPQCIFNLYEGNIANSFFSDGYFGGSLGDTLFRNWATGWTESFPNDQSRALALYAWSIRENVIGNVLGITNITPPTNAIFPTDNPPNFNAHYLIMAGYPDNGGAYNAFRPPDTNRASDWDCNVTNTMILVANWDSVAQRVNNPTNLPSSLYLTSKPAWFGNLNWPPIDPSKGYTNLYWTSIPAGYRYINGTDPPSRPAPPANLHVVSAGP